jgi:hypothetical protein
MEAGTTIMGVMVMVSLLRVLLRIIRQNTEAESEADIALIHEEADEAQTEDEQMTPKYLPPPCAAGDGKEKNKKETENEIQP